MMVKLKLTTHLTRRSGVKSFTMRHNTAAGESHVTVDKRHLITDVRER